jgi:TPR repeat protein
MDIQQSKGTVKLSLAQKKEMTVCDALILLTSTIHIHHSHSHFPLQVHRHQNQHRLHPQSQSRRSKSDDISQRDLSLGLFEIANCFLEGSGTKKSPEVALNYLKLAANMGDLASQERESAPLTTFTRTQY